MKGDKLFQVRARSAFPILVRQAKAQQIITYTDLAKELKMPNPRNLNYVLGYIARSIRSLNKRRDDKIPYVNILVVGKNTELPGKGAINFLKNKRKFRQSNQHMKRVILDDALSDIFNFNDWDGVLLEFKLRPAESLLPNRNIIQNKINRIVKYGSGESPDHKRFKNLIAQNPNLIGLPKNIGSGKIEYSFLSGDKVDILFKNKDHWIGVEVKSKRSPKEDIIRGIFQIIKYHSLLIADLIVKQKPPIVTTLLVLEGAFPSELLQLSTALGIIVKDCIKAK